MDNNTVYQDFRIQITIKSVEFCRMRKTFLTYGRTSQNKIKTLYMIWINSKILFSQTTNLNCDGLVLNKIL